MKYHFGLVHTARIAIRTNRRHRHQFEDGFIVVLVARISLGFFYDEGALRVEIGLNTLLALIQH
ncbi:MAG: hypothetical protein K2G46_06240, partial [Bacteroidales bacterium]|nr:hypothetical protein [Bacteroidales bacterium]